MSVVKTYDVVYIGNYTKDTIISPSGTRYVDGGGMNYAAHRAQRGLDSRLLWLPDWQRR
jgi:hypothetical protein